MYVYIYIYMYIYVYIYVCVFYTQQFGGFRKWGYPPIIHAHRIVHYKQSILGYPHFRKTPFASICVDQLINVFSSHAGKGRQKGLLHVIPTVDFMWLKR